MKSNKLFIYQLLPRLFGNTSDRNKFNGTIEENGCGKFNDISLKVLKELKKSGYTHVWYIGILAHASTTDYTTYGIPKEYPEIIKGKAGSPYAVRDYYDVDPDLAVDVNNRMEEFEDLIARTHKVGLKVIIDNIPNHLARNYKSVAKPRNVKDFGETDNISLAFSAQNNFYYLPNQSLDLQFVVDNPNRIDCKEFPAKVTGNDSFTNQPSRYDWYETVKLNYGVDYLNGKLNHFDPIPNTWLKMRDILLFWANKKVDGFRCDMAEMVPIEFWRWAIKEVKAQFSDIIFVAEIYSPTIYRDFLADNTFDYLYDKVGLYDMLRDVACGYKPSSDITFALNAVGDIQDKMLNFLENHDEQRLASDYFLGCGERAKAAMIVTACVGKNPVMVYAGQEFGERGMDTEGFSGQDGRTTIFDYWSVDTLRKWNDNGKWDSKLLTKNEQILQQFYQKLITLCNDEKAISNGSFYDLMPANYENPAFDSTRQFAFLRSNKKELLLIIVNFDNVERKINVHIPQHAFDFLGFENMNSGKLTPLLEKKTKEVAFSKENLTVTIGGNDGEVYRVCLRK
ncbi:MAG: alpha-amylase family protein [Dysgonamonadaceae bacterium]|jgi:glycosidase|nr:alpha-amylase family protein [Dysgonamonadaceae bacterium]